MQLVECPEPGCIQTAEVFGRHTLFSTDGPMPHVKTRCLAGHLLTVPVDRLVDGGWK